MSELPSTRREVSYFNELGTWEHVNGTSFLAQCNFTTFHKILNCSNSRDTRLTPDRVQNVLTSNLHHFNKIGMLENRQNGHAT